MSVPKPIAYPVLALIVLSLSGVFIEAIAQVLPYVVVAGVLTAGVAAYRHHRSM